MNPALKIPTLQAAFLKVLIKAQKRREELGPLYWVIYERQAMQACVNTERRSTGLPLVTLEDVERVESMAEGHSDYSSKFALYCAELALGFKDIRP